MSAPAALGPLDQLCWADGDKASTLNHCFISHPWQEVLDILLCYKPLDRIGEAFCCLKVSVCLCIPLVKTEQ